MKANPSYRAILIVLWIIIIFTSCNTLEENINDSISDIPERTDMTFSGNISYQGLDTILEYVQEVN